MTLVLGTIAPASSSGPAVIKRKVTEVSQYQQGTSQASVTVDMFLFSISQIENSDQQREGEKNEDAVVLKGAESKVLKEG